jgi:helicase
MDMLEEFYDSAREFGLVTRERSVASWIRGYVEPEFSEWLDAENTALRVLLDLATHDPLELYAADGKEDLLANILARTLGNSHHETTYQTQYLATLAALTFAGAGNFPSASIFAKQARGNPEAGAAENWMMRFLANPIAGLSEASPPTLFRRYAQLQDTALRGGHADDFDRAHDEWQDACRRAADELGVSDRYLVLLWQHVHERLCELSVARILRETGFPHQGYSAVLVETTSPLFYPPQAQILQEQALIRPGENILVSLPTSTGKSLIGEIALVASLQWKPIDRWLAVYIAPYRALTDQLHERMRQRLRNREVGIACIKRRGNYLTDMSPIRQRLPTIMIATPESFDALLRQHPDLYSCLSACVFDEFHLIEQHQRGLRYEGILGRFLHGAAGNGWPKIVALSAVVTDVEDVKRWLRIDGAGFFHSAWKPTGRRIAVTSPSGKVEYFPLGEQIPDVPVSEPAWQGLIGLPYRIDKAPAKPVREHEYARYRKAIGLLDQQVRSNVVAVALDQYKRFQEPVLILASSRADTQLIASLTKNYLHERAPGSPACNLAFELEQRCPHLFTLRECLRYGVAYHNASLPDWVRRGIEELIGRRELDVVAATTTLAEGVDMPFRVVVMADWQSWLFGQKRPMPTLLFHNIAGRCGRAWEFSEGDTIIVDNPGREPTYFRDRHRDYVTRYAECVKHS